MTVGSLFSGIGGLDLGLERAGMRVMWQSEIDPYASKVLAKHWPHVPNLGDVTTIDWSSVERVDLICGGYPCQPFSYAGRRDGENDPRHLWPYFARALRVLRPRWALLENVPGHLSLGFGTVHADLAALGYDTEWECIPASALGAPHIRDRVFVVSRRATATAPRAGGVGVLADAQVGRQWSDQDEPGRPPEPYVVTVAQRSGEDVADPGGARRRQDTRSAPSDEGEDEGRPAPQNHVSGGDGQGDRAGIVADTDRSGQADIQGCSAFPERPGRRAVDRAGWWDAEPDVGRVADEVPHRVDRLRCLGNAVVPQVAEYVGRQIVAAAGRER